jgi:hypothetical protein
MSVSRKLFREFIDQSLLSLPAALLAVLMASTLSAQIVETGVITGVVRDSAGAVIVKANVTVVNTGTGLASHTATDSQGLYASPPLNPGDYNVEVEAPSFGKVVEHARLEVGQRLAVDVVLAVGAAAETIEVQSADAVLETESSTVSNLRTERAVQDLPLNGRNFAELVGLAQEPFLRKPR